MIMIISFLATSCGKFCFGGKLTIWQFNCDLFIIQAKNHQIQCSKDDDNELVVLWGQWVIVYEAKCQSNGIKSWWNLKKLDAKIEFEDISTQWVMIIEAKDNEILRNWTQKSRRHKIKSNFQMLAMWWNLKTWWD